MAHYAKIVNDVVETVIVAEQDFIDTMEGEWLQTSYNTFANQHSKGKTPLRGNYAGIGYVYDRVNDVFYAPQPYASWTLDTATWQWLPPVPIPDPAKRWLWDEDTTQWVEDI